MAGEYLLVIDDSPTVLKVIELALTEAGYKVVSAANDEVALATVREARTIPDLILLDGLIPGRDAAEICRRFAAEPTLARVPVVVMTARGQAEDLEARFAKASNVVDYIAKPFSPEALVAVVSHLATGAAARPKGSVAPPAAVRAVVAEAMALSSADAGAVAEARAFAAAGQALAGDLGAISMSQILELLSEQAHTGILRVVNLSSHARVDLYLQDGRVDFAAATGAPEEFLLGRFVVDSGDVSAEDVARVLGERARAPGRVPLFGADLVARGLLSREALGIAMARQTSELAYETLRWNTGFFQFRAAAELPPLAREAGLQLNVDRMLLEGYRRVDEWRIIEREISSFDEVFVRNEDKIAGLPRGTFTRDELAVLEQVDGRQNLREIVRKLRIGSFDVSKMFFRFRRSRLVRKRVAPTST
ncbi:MAG TPA: response regulator [Polyangia bacterium]|nr:response regulator [Polyangia bacterium]